jgi:hypothetical protein
MLSKSNKIIRQVAALTGIVILELLVCLPAFCEDSQQVENFRRNWAEHPETRRDGFILMDPRAPIILADRNWSRTPAPSHDYLEPIILYYFDSSKLTPTSKLQYSLDFKSGKLGVSKSPGLNKRERFYCEQAIWEAMPFSNLVDHPVLESIQFNHENGKSRDFESDSLFFKKHPDLEGAAIVTAHIIPASVTDQFDKSIPYSEIYSYKNINGIKLADVDSDKLAAYRKDWIDYIEAHKKDKITREDLLAQAIKLLKKYPDLFLL